MKYLFTIDDLMIAFISTRLLGVSMVSYLLWELGFFIGLPLLTFVLCIIIRRRRSQKIREQYGDGSQGFVFDVTDKDIEEVNKENQLVRGEYDADRAVNTRTGVFVGEEEKGTMIYLGIPVRSAVAVACSPLVTRRRGCFRRLLYFSGIRRPPITRLRLPGLWQMIC